MTRGDRCVVSTAGVDDLIQALLDAGYRVVGPTARDGSIVLSDIFGVGDLPVGLGDKQARGRYRLHPRGDDALFGFNCGPHSFRRVLHEPRVELWRARHSDGQLCFEAADPQPELPLALFGARACDVAGIAIQDRVLAGGDHADRHYAARRRTSFVVAVNCGVSAETCFCTSMEAGPPVDHGYDLALTELLQPSHRFVVQVGSDRGAALARAAGFDTPATPDDLADAEAVVSATLQGISRHLETDGLAKRLAQRLEHPRWQETADRCLACASCTLSCPTCFCTTVEDFTSLDGQCATRCRRWDSCFGKAFTWVHGGSVRGTRRARYRQWLTHKLGTWQAQFGTAGCVGCGRCITFCPVGIDITEEATAIAADAADQGEDHGVT